MTTSRAPLALTVISASLMVGAVIYAIAHAWVADDIYITFRYCEQLLAGNGPVYNAGEHSEGYSHFLWFLMLTLLHAVHIPAEWMGRYLGVPFFAATLWLLWSLSRRLFRHQHAVALPVAALAWAAHEDARLFASGGLETACFTFFLLLGFFYLVASSHCQRHSLGAWALSAACLLRPEGTLFLGVAIGFVFWQLDLRQALRFTGLALLLVLPLYVFRLAYYGYPFPNPYYAKSADLSYWVQGWRYLTLYLRVYPALLLAIPMGMLAIFSAVKSRSNRQQQSALCNPTPVWILAATFAALHFAAVTRLGGDFMFARFYLPSTPFVLLLCEAFLRRLRPVRLQAVAAVGFVLSIFAGGFWKDTWLGDGRHFWGIVDEPQYYPRARLELARDEGRRVASCFAGSGARVLIVAGQLMHAYYARYPQAIELCGLTDATVAHSPVQQRQRPGHEKFADAAYIYARKVHFRQRTRRQARALPPYAVLTFPNGQEQLFFEIIVYDAVVLQHLQDACPELQFHDFPAWFHSDYLPTIASNATARLIRDYQQFRRFYFDGNPGHADLLQFLVAELRARGIEQIPESPPPAQQFRDFSPYVRDGVLLPH